MPNHSLTPGAQRVLAAAARRAFAASATFGLPELLWGMLADEDSLAAKLLARGGVDISAVALRWPVAAYDDERIEASARPDAEVEAALQAAGHLLFAYPPPITVATEHLLLGMLASGSHVSAWLNQRGFQFEALANEIHARWGIEQGPLEIDWDEPSKALPESPQPPSMPRDNPASVVASQPTDIPIGVLRIFDAAANRASEGLRVVEDFARFALDDRHLTGRLKQLRHRLTAALAGLPRDTLLAARDANADVGRQVTVGPENARTNEAAVLAANFKRLQQALRSLEEYAKLHSPPLAAELESLRYESYALERALDTAADSRDRLAAARLYVLLDGRESVAEFAALAQKLCAVGVHVIQLRDKRLSDRVLLERGRLLRSILRDSQTLLVVNDRPDIAALIAADAVHVGQDELTVKDARAIIGPTMLAGVSTHSVAQAHAAVIAGANYLGVGPTFESRTKQFAAFAGLELTSAVSKSIRLPWFAIGGIRLDNAKEVLAAGATRLAVSDAVVNAPRPEEAAAAFLRLLEE